MEPRDMINLTQASRSGWTSTRRVEKHRSEANNDSWKSQEVHEGPPQTISGRRRGTFVLLYQGCAYRWSCLPLLNSNCLFAWTYNSAPTDDLLQSHGDTDLEHTNWPILQRFRLQHIPRAEEFFPATFTSLTLQYARPAKVFEPPTSFASLVYYNTAIQLPHGTKLQRYCC